MSAAMPIIVDTEQTRKDNLIKDLRIVQDLIEADLEVSKIEFPFTVFWTTVESSRASIEIMESWFGDPTEINEYSRYAYLTYRKNESETFRLFISFEKDSENILRHENVTSLVNRLELIVSSKEK